MKKEILAERVEKIIAIVGMAIMLGALVILLFTSTRAIKPGREGEISGTIERISVCRDSGVFTLEGVPKIFYCDKRTSSEILVTRVGDRVKLSYRDPGGDFVFVSSFNNLEIKAGKKEMRDNF